jgi:hypothetical protein
MIRIAQRQKQEQIVGYGKQIIAGPEILCLRKPERIAKVCPAPGSYPYKDGKAEIQKSAVEAFGRIVLL